MAQCDCLLSERAPPANNGKNRNFPPGHMLGLVPRPPQASTSKPFSHWQRQHLLPHLSIPLIPGRIEDCYVVSGDDCVAIKSGWDEYGIAVGMPSQHISIRRLTCVSPTSAVIALGSEMSGGIEDVRAESITAVDTESGVRIKTAVGRGAYVRNVFVRGFAMHTMKWAFWMTGNYGSHPDDHYDPKAIPVVSGISYADVVAENVTTAGRLEGIPGAPFTGICISNVTIGLVKSKKLPWTCTDVEGVSSSVTPQPCPALSGAPEQGGAAAAAPCPFPEDTLPIDQLQFKECSFTVVTHPRLT